MSAIENFDKRVAELNVYISFLSDIDRNGVVVGSPRGSRGLRAVSADARKILRANFFVIFYNAAESTVRDVIDDIHQDITTRQTSFRTLTTDWRLMFVKQRLRRNFQKHAHPETHYEAVLNLCDTIVGGGVLRFSSRQLPLAGNVDQKLIGELCKRMGIQLAPPKRSRAGSDLETIKDHRNALAHGDMPFSELGKDLFASDLAKVNKRSIAYLRHFVDRSAKFIERSGYVRR